MGTILQVDETRGDKRFVIETPWNMTEVPLGASIACSGCCLTVVGKTTSSFTVDVSAESISKTNLGDWKVGSQINLESSLRFGDELGGHLVSGHVDGVATLEKITPEGDSHRLKIRVPKNLKHFIAPKGSVALDGISLTINEVEDDVFGVNIIPHTWDVTTLGQRQESDALNIEIDMLARYVARILGKEEA